MFLLLIILVDFSRSWFLVISFVRAKVPSWMQILGLILSERIKGSAAELSPSCCAVSVHLHFVCSECLRFRILMPEWQAVLAGLKAFKI